MAFGLVLNKTDRLDRFAARLGEGLRMPAVHNPPATPNTPDRSTETIRLARVDALLNDPVWLRARYETDRMTIPQIAAAAVTSARRVRAAMAATRIRARAGGIAAALPAVDTEWLTARFVTDQMTAPEIAAACRRAPSGMRPLLHKHGLVGPGLVAPLLENPGWLRARYETDRLGPAEVAALAGTTATDVIDALRRYRIRVRSSRAHPPLLEDAGWLRARYETDGLTATQVAVLAGAAQSSVTEAMRRHKILARTSVGRFPRTPEQKQSLADPVWLRARYEGDLLSTTQVGVLAGVSRTVVLRALHRHHIPVRRWPPAGPELNDPVWLRAQYETGLLSASQIARLTGASRSAVLRALTRHAVDRRPRVLRAELNDPVWLAARYVTDGLMLTQIGMLIGVSGTTIGSALRRHGIKGRPRKPPGSRPGQNHKLFRPELNDPVWLAARYVTDGLTTEKVGGLLGISGTTVGAALARHGIARRPAHRPRSARLDDPVWLRARYETDLLPLQQIGGLVGASVNTIANALRRHQIPVRPKGFRPLSRVPRPDIRGTRESGPMPETTGTANSGGPR